jgi:integrase
LDILDRTSFVGLRSYTLILVMLDTDIKPNELLQITIRDIDFSNAQMIVREDSKTR